MTEYIKGFSFIIEKAKVFIEASTLDMRGDGSSSALISIEAPRLRSVAACFDDGQTRRKLKQIGIHSPSEADFRELRASMTYECRFWSADTRQWKEALVRPQYAVALASAKSSDPVLLVDAAGDKPNFQSIPLTEESILELCGMAFSADKDVIYVGEGMSAELNHPDDWEKAFDEILRNRASREGE